MQFTKPEGYPALIKFNYLGMTVLLDYEEGSIHPLTEAEHQPGQVLKYLVDEGFLVPDNENESSGREEND